MIQSHVTQTPEGDKGSTTESSGETTKSDLDVFNRWMREGGAKKSPPRVFTIDKAADVSGTARKDPAVVSSLDDSSGLSALDKSGPVRKNTPGEMWPSEGIKRGRDSGKKKETPSGTGTSYASAAAQGKHTAGPPEDVNSVEELYEKTESGATGQRPPRQTEEEFQLDEANEMRALRSSVGGYPDSGKPLIRTRGYIEFNVLAHCARRESQAVPSEGVFSSEEEVEEVDWSRYTAPSSGTIYVDLYAGQDPRVESPQHAILSDNEQFARFQE